MMDQNNDKRTLRLWAVADRLLDRVEGLMEERQEPAMNTQAIRHISATLKDIRDIQMLKGSEDRREQLARVRKLELQLEKEAAEEKALEIRVVLEAGPEEWNA